MSSQKNMTGKKTRMDLVDFRVAQIIEMADEYTWLGARRSRMEYQVGKHKK
jgi:hypothetical protein